MKRCTHVLNNVANPPGKKQRCLLEILKRSLDLVRGPNVAMLARARSTVRTSVEIGCKIG